MKNQTIERREGKISVLLLLTAVGLAVVLSWGGAFVYYPDRLTNFFLFAAAPGAIPASILGLLLGYGHGPPPMAQLLLSLPFNFLFYAVLLWGLETLVRSAVRKRRDSRSQT